MHSKQRIVNIRNKVIISLIFVLGILNILTHISTHQPLKYFYGSIGLLVLTSACLFVSIKQKFVFSIMYINTFSVFIVLFISNTQEIFLSNITSLMAVLVLINIYQDWKVTLTGSVLAFANINYIMYFNESFRDAFTNFDGVSPVFVNLAFVILSSALISQAILSEKFRLKSEENEKKALHLAYHDPLTGLVNRLKINLEIKKFIEKIEQDPKYELAMMIIDLDNFKIVNDTLGHDKGDALLIQIAELLQSCVRDTGVVGRIVGRTVGRMGGDEFIILIPTENNDSESISCSIAEQILESMKKPILIDGLDILNTFTVTASIGISTAPKLSKDPVVLFKYADIAMYQAKRNGKNQYSVYRSNMAEPLVSL